MPIKIGFISPFWLPNHGGGEQYDYRLAKVLTEKGFHVSVFCGIAARPGKDNGTLPVTRHTPEGDFDYAVWKTNAPQGDVLPDKEVFRHYRFMDEAVAWAVSGQLDIALVSNPLQQVSQHHARELYLQIKAHGIKVGATHFDLSPGLEKILSDSYMKQGGDWESVAARITGNLRNFLSNHDRLQAYFEMGSPLFFSPDFILSCSEWSHRFIDPLGTLPGMVVHPLLDEQHWRGNAQHTDGLDRRDVLMVNPQYRKGPTHMANLIQDAAPNRTFRLLKGGWGDSFEKFLPKINGLPAAQEGRVDIREYVLDMREAYRAAKVVFFPSYFEGYGMTAVEPMYAGTAVVSSSYPAVLEAVGEGARLICPYRMDRRQCLNAVEEVLNNLDDWRSRSLARADELTARQGKEIEALVSFLTDVAN